MTALRPPHRLVLLLVAGLSAALLAVGLLAGGADAATLPGAYYVSPTGNDAADGSLAAPWRTLEKATSTAPAGSTVLVAGGTYAPFTVTKPGQTVSALPGQAVVVQGQAGVRDVILVSASAVSLDGLTVSGCVPDPAPASGFEDSGSSAVRIDDGTTGVTVRDLTIADSEGTNSYGQPFGCYGVFAHDASAFSILDSDISGTGTGVFVNGGGQQAVISGNQIHDNDVIIRDSPGGNDDFGGDGVDLINVDAVPGVLATQNVVFNNAGPSLDYGTDGGAFELYNASNTQILANTISNNADVLETGSSPNGGVCANNLFSGNQATGRTAGSSLALSIGMILRCATTMVVDNNTFSGIDWWVYDIETNDVFSTNVNGLAITGNTQSQSDPVYRLGVDPVATKLVIEGNRFPTTGWNFAVYDDGTASRDLADWQQRTGEDTVSIAQ